MANAPINNDIDNSLLQIAAQLAERIDALESRNVFQDDIIEQLSGEIAHHQAKISELKEQLQLMATRLKEANTEMPDAGQHIEPPPPHF